MTPTGWAMAGDPIIFAHEVAHIFGCLHNREEPVVNGGNANEARYGYLMTGSTDSSGRNGKRTIMAYQDPNWVYTQAINHFSDNYQWSGVSYRLGDSMNDNNDQIRLSAPALAAIGDESCGCANQCKTCRDADPRGEAFCQQYISGCTDSRYPWFANDNCQKTCGTCTQAGVSHGFYFNFKFKYSTNIFSPLPCSCCRLCVEQLGSMGIL